MDREAILHDIETDPRLDRAADALAPLASAIAGQGARKDLLSGTWLGHPAHPMAVFAPLSFFFSASVLDVVGGPAGRRAARRLLALGVITALPAAAAGMSDWSDTSGAERRTGVVHAASNTAALALYAASWRQRRRGDTGRGVVTALLGSAMAGIGGYLGGHLSYRRGVGVDATTFQAGPTEWRAVLPLAELSDARPHRVVIDDVALLVVERGGSVSVLEDRCTHRGGPLHEGTLDGDCITCPWHGSSFDLSTGAVRRGPATAPQPAYQVRIHGGQVEVRRDEPAMLRRSFRSAIPTEG